jgi:hypothetical protein
LAQDNRHVGFIWLLASLSTFKPPLQGCLRFTRASARQQTFDADVLVEIRPVNAFAFADETPTTSFGGTTVCQARVPSDGDRDRTAIDQFDYQRVVSDGHALGSCLGNVTLEW